MGGREGVGGYSQAPLLVDFMYTGRHMSYRQPVVLYVHIFYTVMYFLVNTTEKVLCACIVYIWRFKFDLILISILFNVHATVCTLN